MKLIDVIVGARPNFMKVCPLFHYVKGHPDLKLRLVHTGQHYDASMSANFMGDFNLPKPDFFLDVGSGRHAVQTAKIMMGYDEIIRQNCPDLCLVVGDVNSTIGCALTAVKEGVKVGHIEAGLRSGDRAMPEEINRILTDSISDFLFVTEPSGKNNLDKEGCDPSKIFFVGNVMIDTLLLMKDKAARLTYCDRFDLNSKEYAYLTLHRPSNVDDEKKLNMICEQIEWVVEQIPIIFSIHPRTEKRLKEFHLWERLKARKDIFLVGPLTYFESLNALMNAKMLLTDSGGMQEESTVLAVPCLTLRENTERPITLTQGTNTLIGADWNLLREQVAFILNNREVLGAKRIEGWDGMAAQRILTICNSMI